MLQANTVLRTYFTIIFFAVFALMSLFWQYADPNTLSVKLYMLAATTGYAVFYLLPAILISKIVIWSLKLAKNTHKWHLWLVYFVAWFLSSLAILAIYADYKLFQLYEYHFNGFVWNLLITPGGVEALGATTDTMITIVLQVVAVLSSTILVLWLAQRVSEKKSWVSKRLFVTFINLMLAVLLVEESVHAYSKYVGKEDYLRAGIVIPFNLNSHGTHFLKRIGIKPASTKDLKFGKGKVVYPLSKIETKPLDEYPNIIMLVAESFRWDLLDPEITPNLWALSKKSVTFNQHYSGGNRTRMGIFSMFYGLHAPYWYSFEEQRVAPVLMNVIRQKNYQLGLYTSQSFDYPELRHTTFVGIPEEDLHEIKSGVAWKRDVDNVTNIINHLEQTNKNKPSYTFMFFESTHAPYTFPEEDVIRPDYLKEMNYAKLDLLNNVDLIHNRYINAAHHVDKEVGRLLDYLKQNNKLDNTIVLFTGDHGEEFMEKGHWGHGHNEAFPEQQVHVPMIMWMPGEKPQQINTKTSHIQIPQTLLAKLGVTTSYKEHSLAGDLFSALPYLVMGNYNYVSIFDKNYKVTFPFTASDYFHYTLYDKNDMKVLRSDKEPAMLELKPSIDNVVEESKRFLKQL
ncbi:MAG TPA: DUF3413 domain-containing protein [Methylophaga sp.]|nr:DUF3413 domain-containing protein [Methylophaga sp.]HEC59967.1 DUF3413 domain-containing protein [Methylophaga sp.]